MVRVNGTENEAVLLYEEDAELRSETVTVLEEVLETESVDIVVVCEGEVECEYVTDFVCVRDADDDGEDCEDELVNEHELERVPESCKLKVLVKEGDWVAVEVSVEYDMEDVLVQEVLADKEDVQDKDIDKLGECVLDTDWVGVVENPCDDEAVVLSLNEEEMENEWEGVHVSLTEYVREKVKVIEYDDVEESDSLENDKEFEQVTVGEGECVIDDCEEECDDVNDTLSEHDKVDEALCEIVRDVFVDEIDGEEGVTVNEKDPVSEML